MDSTGLLGNCQNKVILVSTINNRKKVTLCLKVLFQLRSRIPIKYDYHTYVIFQLRSRIPTQPTDVKLTKVETLRLAMSYILHLENLVGDFKENDEITGSSEVSSTSGPGTKDTRVRYSLI